MGELLKRRLLHECIIETGFATRMIYRNAVCSIRDISKRGLLQGLDIQTGFTTWIIY